MAPPQPARTHNAQEADQTVLPKTPPLNRREDATIYRPMPRSCDICFFETFSPLPRHHFLCAFSRDTFPIQSRLLLDPGTPPGTERRTVS